MVDFMRTKTVKALLDTLPERPLIAISEDATVEEAYRLLLEHDILSLPVWKNAKEDGTDTIEYIAVVDILDLLHFTLPQPVFQSEPDVTVEASHCEPDANFLRHSVKEAMGLANGSRRLHTVDASASLQELVHVMSQGVHRVLVLPNSSAKGNLTSNAFSTTAESPPWLISQVDLVRYLFAHNEHFDDLLNTEVEAVLQRLDRERSEARIVHTMSAQSKAIAGFQGMKTQGVSSLGVVDQEGVLVAVLSAADLRGLTAARIHEVFQPVIPFLRRSKGYLPAPATCTSKFTLGQVTAQLLLQKRHRSFVVQEVPKGSLLGKTPIGVVSLTDVLSAFDIILGR